MPVYYSKKDEEDLVFHVFLGCPEGSKIDRDDRVEKVKRRTVCQDCLVLMKSASWVQGNGQHAHEAGPQLKAR